MLKQKLSDKELVKLYLKGDEYALECLINRHRDKVYTSIYMFVKDTYLAEDIFQETFIKVVDTLRSGKYHEEGKFLPWVLRIAHNLCIDFFRKTKRSPSVTNPEGFDIFNILVFAEENAEQKIIKNQTHRKVRQLLEELPQEQKEIVILRHYANLSFKEIANITGVSINTALGRMRYALINLRKIIEEKAISL
ncbi:MAG: sigma-70 family RNA polymerase sigma factor [Chitinophagaceae bacterium]|nr:MAG: sigma-70 family RNA polymerase sigma factor [Chitinophagaceae bacterium]